MYDVLVPKKVIRHIEKMPESIQDRMADLLRDLKDSGPFQPLWPNYGKLGPGRIIAIYPKNGWPAGIMKRIPYESRCTMLAVVKTPHIKIHIEGRIPPRLITVLKKEYGKGVRLVDDNEEDNEQLMSFRPTGIGEQRPGSLLARI